jgi:DNA-binding beta-propeller fold protein YncE
MKMPHGWVDGPPATARFYYPRSVAVDNRGNVFVADYANQCIRKINFSGHVQTLAGKGEKGFKDGPGKLALFKDPCGLVAAERGSVIYVCDQSNRAVRKIGYQKEGGSSSRKSSLSGAE